MKIETTGVDGNGFPLASQQPPQRLLLLLGKKVPGCVLQRLFKWESHAPHIAAAHAANS